MSMGPESGVWKRGIFWGKPKKKSGPVRMDLTRSLSRKKADNRGNLRNEERWLKGEGGKLPGGAMGEVECKHGSASRLTKYSQRLKVEEIFSKPVGYWRKWNPFRN